MRKKQSLSQADKRSVYSARTRYGGEIPPQVMAKWPKEKQIFANQVHSRKVANKQSGLSGKDRAFVNTLNNAAFITRFKETMGCECCGFVGPGYMFDLDHIKPETKHTRSNRSAAPRTMKFDDLQDEIRKCRVLCKNCHARITFEQKHFMNSSNVRSKEKEHLQANFTPELEKVYCLFVAEQLIARQKRNKTKR